jgi:hypothetical protein
LNDWILERFCVMATLALSAEATAMNVIGAMTAVTLM